MPRVLIVEDDEDVRHMMELLLSSYSYETESARNGKEALEHMQERRPCLVLLDMMMPVMDGWEFRRRQLQDPDLANVPVVCITAHFAPEQIQQALGLVCLPKPTEFASVLAVVKGACGQARA